MHSYKEGNIPTDDRLAMNSPTRVCAQSMPQQITIPGNPTMCPGLEATELQSRHGQKRHLDDTEEEATAKEPLHKRPRAKAARQADKDITAHESASGTRGAEDAVKDAKTKQSSRQIRNIFQYGTLEDRFIHQERDNLSTDTVKSSQDGTAEAQQRRKSAQVGSSSIAPPDITARSSGILHNKHSSRSNLGLLKKKVRFEDESPGRVREDSACQGNEFNEAQEQMVVSAGQFLGATQREVLNQPAAADVIMVDVQDALDALSHLQPHPVQ